MRHRDAMRLVGKVVLAEWQDSTMPHGWIKGEPETSVLRCKSAGLLMAATADVVTIAGSWVPEGDPQRAGEITIPRRALVSLRVLS